MNFVNKLSAAAGIIGILAAGPVLAEDAAGSGGAVGALEALNATITTTYSSPATGVYATALSSSGPSDGPTTSLGADSSTPGAVNVAISGALPTSDGSAPPAAFTQSFGGNTAVGSATVSSSGAIDTSGSSPSATPMQPQSVSPSESPAPVPVPPTFYLMAAGLFGLHSLRRSALRQPS